MCGSALLRALAALPFELVEEGSAGPPFQPSAIEDIAPPIAWLAVRRQSPTLWQSPWHGT